ncbi:hypothetical protein PIB30_014847 [Stylosanthes scabra]|uniref:Uncharacterized protein n=1 Tax=Stylosanthes scabra TaxID=79078 RepID=A0ABU6S7F5_9FABA|nr:hypothetical protein [Stylosanthes scabra]
MDRRDERQVEKNRNWTGTESLFNPIHRELSVNTTGIGVHSSIFDLIGHEDMPRFKCGEVMKPVSTAEFGAEVARESERNERIATKPRRPLLDQMRTHPIRGRHAQKAVSAQMRTHSELLCVRISGSQHL